MGRWVTQKVLMPIRMQRKWLYIPYEFAANDLCDKEQCDL